MKIGKSSKDQTRALPTVRDQEGERNSAKRPRRTLGGGKYTNNNRCGGRGGAQGRGALSGGGGNHRRETVRDQLGPDGGRGRPRSGHFLLEFPARLEKFSCD